MHCGDKKYRVVERSQKVKSNRFCILLTVSLSLFSVILLASVFCEAAEKVAIRIWTEKDTFLAHEPIFVYFQIRNEGDSTVYFNSYKMTEHLVITDSQGRGYATRIKGTDLGVDALSPGQAQKLSVDVCSRYGVQEVGKYSCHLRTHLYSVLNPTLLKSNAIEFEVVEPTGEEEKALHLFLEAEKLVWARSAAGGPDLGKRDVGFFKYQELADKYPKSVYAPKALRAAIGAYLHLREHRRRVIPVCLRLIEEYPNSYYWGSGFSHLIGIYEVEKDKAGAMKTIQELIHKHPNTKISERAEYSLEKIEKWEFE